MNRIEALSPGSKLPTAQPAIEGLLNAAKEQGYEDVYAKMERTLVMIVQETEEEVADTVPADSAAAKTRIRALLDRIATLSPGTWNPGACEAVEFVASDDQACAKMGLALMEVVQVLENVGR